jgi:hypothetical protein
MLSGIHKIGIITEPEPWTRRRSRRAHSRRKRPYDAIETGVVDLDDPALKDRIRWHLAECCANSVEPLPKPKACLRLSGMKPNKHRSGKNRRHPVEMPRHAAAQGR